jgi:hypothetical protein
MGYCFDITKADQNVFDMCTVFVHRDISILFVSHTERPKSHYQSLFMFLPSLVEMFE